MSVRVPSMELRSPRLPDVGAMTRGIFQGHAATAAPRAACQAGPGTGTRPEGVYGVAAASGLCASKWTDTMSWVGPL